MRTFRFATIIALSAIGMGTALPAQADTLRKISRSGAQRADVLRSACARSFANSDCGAYQTQVIRSAETRAAAASQPISMHDVAGRQLDALLTTID